MVEAREGGCFAPTRVRGQIALVTIISTGSEAVEPFNGLPQPAAVPRIRAARVARMVSLNMKPSLGCYAR